MQRAAQYVITNQHRYLIGHHCIDRTLPTPLVALVHHIIVHQASRMKQFESQCHIRHALVHLAHRAGCQHHHGGTHHLATAVEDMLQSRMQQRVIRLQRIGKLPAELLQIRLHRCLY